MTDQAQKLGIQPLNDWVILEIVDEFMASDTRGMTAGGIFIPENADTERVQKARVLAVGPGRWTKAGTQRTPVSCAVGDTVLVNRRAGMRFKWHNRELVALREFTGDEQTLVAVVA